ncbi:MAG: 3'(2'),5'-bisphosphate nucleotidase CysQ, partial [Thalassobaculaceae bacterium]
MLSIDRPLLDRLGDICRAAGAEILSIYASDFAVDDKSDGSPVTAADQAAEAVILPALASLAPEIPAIAEESVAAGHIPEITGARFWLIDPLDGTKEFIKKNGDFTVNIGLIEDRTPIAGAVYRPVSDTLWIGAGGVGAWRIDGDGETALTVRTADHDQGLTVIASASHRSPALETYIDNLPKVAWSISRGSSLKFCLIADGEADVYPRLSPTMEWDTAAGHAVVEAAGGRVETPDG